MGFGIANDAAARSLTMEPSQHLDPVFVFARDGILLFKSPIQAQRWVEAADVADGEYEVFIGLDGARLTAVVGDESDGDVRLEKGGTRDPEFLRARLHDYASSRGYEGAPEDPREIANEIFANEWKRAWPRWWPWLRRRLHGDHPPAV
ncbi:hypothetical protein [Cellulomonas rhizosphaerae]|uniref:hypothetical protein n=1 Tax=Cellulomonas rhizosphaerae TaxID=2293719 RepID=UPI0010FDE815|nr:hypothetical protein [Cellulomonas rhizosphaerae]